MTDLQNSPSIANFDPNVPEDGEDFAILQAETEAEKLARGEHLASPFIVARGLLILRHRAMYLAHSATPNGRRYAEQFQRQLALHPKFKPLLSDSGHKAARMVTDGLWCLEHWASVEPRLRVMTPFQLANVNVSSLRVMVQREERVANNRVDDAAPGEPKESPMAKAQREANELKAENAHLREQLDSGVFSVDDTARNIARATIGALLERGRLSKARDVMAECKRLLAKAEERDAALRAAPKAKK